MLRFGLKQMLHLTAKWEKKQVSGDHLVQEVLAQIPWGHNLRILNAVKAPVERECYIRYTIEQG